MKKILLTAIFVLSLFIMCGGCHEGWGHDRDEYRHSERWEHDSDRDKDRGGDRDSESRHDERR